jgi:hypothetical protein
MDAQTFRYVTFDRADYIRPDLHVRHLRISVTPEGRELLQAHEAEAARRLKRYHEEMHQIRLKFSDREQQEAQLLKLRRQAHLLGPLDVWAELMDGPWSNGWHTLSDADFEKIGALTSNPYTLAQATTGDDGLIDIAGVEGVWFFNRYQIEDVTDTLLMEGSILFDWSPL